MDMSTQVLSPLDQFEIRNLISLDAPVLGNFSISLTNIGLYLTIGGILVFMLFLLSNNAAKVISNG
jgi:F-type H+-transporting ATPase subunit a